MPKQFEIFRLSNMGYDPLTTVLSVTTSILSPTSVLNALIIMINMSCIQMGSKN